MILSRQKTKNNTSILLFFLCFCLLGCSNSKDSFQRMQGNVFGTTFHIVYLDEQQRNFEDEVADLFHNFNTSLSTYHANSTISSLNNGRTSVEVDDNFKQVFLLSKKIHKETTGYFDPTIGKMVNAWGFGPKKHQQNPSDKQVDSLMHYVGFEKVSIVGNTIRKEEPSIYLDFNAIAKGYGVDVVAQFLEGKGVENYLVEIGGEIRAKGVNAKNKLWSVGIENPNFDGSRSLTKITSLQNEAIATSGNYRKFKIDTITGTKIAHTLNPKTGFPAQTDLLSVSVIGSVSCAEVDAYATSFMAMGYQQAKQLALKNKQLKVFFIYLEEDKIKTFASEQFMFVD